VLGHVQADAHLGVGGYAGIGAPDDDGNTTEPGHEPHDRPVNAGFSDAKESDHVERGGDEARGEEEWIDTEAQGDRFDGRWWWIREAEK